MAAGAVAAAMAAGASAVAMIMDVLAVAMAAVEMAGNKTTDIEMAATAEMAGVVRQ